MAATIPVQTVLELACSAQRVNGSYIKELEWLYDADGNPLARKDPNKTLIQLTMGLLEWHDEPRRPPALEVTEADKTQAAEIRQYFKRLLFSAVIGDNEFQTTVNNLLSSETMLPKEIGYVACLPSVHVRDKARTTMKRGLRECESGFIAEVGKSIVDKDCEIIEVKRSNNFDAYNILAIIDNKIVSWFSKHELKVGDCIVQKAKVKQHGENWLTKNSETRLNYVKAAQ